MCQGRFTQSNFCSQLLLKFKETSDASTDFYELKQWQKNNWIDKMDRVNRPMRPLQKFQAKINFSNNECHFFLNFPYITLSFLGQFLPTLQVFYFLKLGLFMAG